MKSFILVFLSLFLLQKITNTAYTRKARSNVDTANVNDMILVTPTIADRTISHLVLLFLLCCLRSGFGEYPDWARAQRAPPVPVGVGLTFLTDQQVIRFMQTLYAC